MKDNLLILLCSGGLGAVFLIIGICILAYFFRVTNGIAAVGRVVEHVQMTSHRDGHTHMSIHARVEYYINGEKFTSINAACNGNKYPLGAELKILVNKRNLNNFIFPDEKSFYKLTGIVFVVTGIFAIGLGVLLAFNIAK